MATIYEIAAGMMQEERRQELIAMNLAGAPLPGFKGRYLISNTFDQELDQAETEALIEDSVVQNLQQGPLRRTERALDFALTGEGFFSVRTAEDQVLLTRNGDFQLSPDGILQTSEGHVVLDDEGQPIRFEQTMNSTDLRVAEDGTILLPGPQGETPLARVGVVTVDEPQEMLRPTANYFLPGENQQVKTAGDEYQVVNRYLEGANVSPVREMATMIQCVRDFELGQKMLLMLQDISDQEQQTLTS